MFSTEKWSGPLTITDRVFRSVSHALISTFNPRFYLVAMLRDSMRYQAHAPISATFGADQVGLLSLCARIFSHKYSFIQQLEWTNHCN